MFHSLLMGLFVLLAKIAPVTAVFDDMLQRSILQYNAMRLMTFEVLPALRATGRCHH